jgi:hypothetical protein
MFLTRQPIQYAQQVHGGRRQQMLKMDFCHTHVAGTAYAQRIGRLGNRAFNSCPLFVGFLERFRVCALKCGSGMKINCRPCVLVVQRWRTGHA